MNILKQKAFGYLERVAAKTATVLEVRQWEPATVYEVDLHLPAVIMDNWKHVQHIKIKVDEWTYRDYSPALWDSETSTCTLLIDAAHAGVGSNWVKRLSQGQQITYLGIASTSHKPVQEEMFCIGDASAMAHFLALEQLAGTDARFSGLIKLNHPDHVEQFCSFFRTGLEAVFANTKKPVYPRVEEVIERELLAGTVFLAGGIAMVKQAKKLIKEQKWFEGEVKAHGFWT